MIPHATSQERVAHLRNCATNVQAALGECRKLLGLFPAPPLLLVQRLECHTREVATLVSLVGPPFEGDQIALINVNAARHDADQLLGAMQACCAAIDTLRLKTEIAGSDPALGAARHHCGVACRYARQLVDFAQLAVDAYAGQPVPKRDATPIEDLPPDRVEPLRLTGAQHLRLVTLLVDAFRDYKDIELLAQMHLDINLQEIAPNAPLKQVASSLINHYQACGELPKLIAALVAARPRRTDLHDFATTLGISVAPDTGDTHGST